MVGGDGGNSGSDEAKVHDSVLPIVQVLQAGFCKAV